MTTWWNGILVRKLHLYWQPFYIAIAVVYTLFNVYLLKCTVIASCFVNCCAMLDLLLCYCHRWSRAVAMCCNNIECWAIGRQLPDLLQSDNKVPWKRNHNRTDCSQITKTTEIKTQFLKKMAVCVAAITTFVLNLLRGFRILLGIPTLDLTKGIMYRKRKDNWF